MANPEHLALLKQGAEAWNQWRQTTPDLSEANLRGLDLRGANLRKANLSRANLFMADLSGVDLSGANLLVANFSGVDLSKANLSGADLSGTDLSEAKLRNTLFAGINLAGVNGLDTCHHEGPSHLNFQTLQQFGPLPLAFLRECGLPDLLIECLASLLK